MAGAGLGARRAGGRRYVAGYDGDGGDAEGAAMEAIDLSENADFVEKSVFEPSNRVIGHAGGSVEFGEGVG